MITNKIINITLNVIIFLIPLLALPHGINSIPYNILKIVSLLICGLVLLISLIIKRKELKFDIIDKTLIVFYILIILSTIFSINKIKSVIGEYNRYEGLLTLTVYFLIYYCAKYYFTYNKNIKIFAITTLSICSIIGILQYYNIFPLYQIFNIPYKVGFASSTFGNRNFFGSFLSIRCYSIYGFIHNKKQKKFFVYEFTIFFCHDDFCYKKFMDCISSCFNFWYYLYNKEL